MKHELVYYLKYKKDIIKRDLKKKRFNVKWQIICE